MGNNDDIECGWKKMGFLLLDPRKRFLSCASFIECALLVTHALVILKKES